jgi:hypothetical protein
MADRIAHLGCPYCCSYEVDRLFLATIGMDACSCRACGAEWDEDCQTGECRGRSADHSALVHVER